METEEVFRESYGWIIMTSGAISQTIVLFVIVRETGLVM
jgi:hypothetical protein